MKRYIEVTFAALAAVAAICSAAAGYFSYHASNRANQISERQLFLYLDDVRFDFQYYKDEDYFSVQPTGHHGVILDRVWVRPMSSSTKYLPADDVALPVIENEIVTNVNAIVCATGQNIAYCSKGEIVSYHVRYSIEKYADRYKIDNDELHLARFQRSQTVRVVDKRGSTNKQGDSLE